MIDEGNLRKKKIKARKREKKEVRNESDEKDKENQHGILDSRNRRKIRNRNRI
jgi:hypothetical protein